LKRKFKVKSINISARVPEVVLEKIKELIDEGYYMDISDYIRDLVRKDLERRT
jgi:Arc/MetJ-type ribon-helix-helix transcriptional regulator